MRKIQVFSVSPTIPVALEFLETLAKNLWWCWNVDAIELFRRMDPQGWRQSGRNPVEFLRRLSQKRMEALAEDDGFLAHVQQVSERFDQEVLRLRNGLPVKTPSRCIAYFSLEFGIHESLNFYSGGLGVLAGDHLKAASDLNLPLVGIGLMYRQGYMRQSITSDGWQQERYPENEAHRLPLKDVRDAKKRRITVTLPMPDGKLHAEVWQIDVGSAPLYMLDANVPENPPHYRQITAQLYHPDRQIRLRQELLLGVGGFEALTALGYDPAVCHINEGHAAFMSLARMAHLRRVRGLDKEAAFELARRTNVFTTHTAVPVGNESFDIALVKPHLQALEPVLDLKTDEIIQWGRRPEAGANEALCMTIVGLRTSCHSNGVSALHGEVERRMWEELWPNKPRDEVPIGHITNGIHLQSWLARDNTDLFDRYLGPEWRANSANANVLEDVMQIPNEQLWHAHETGRARLVRTARELIEEQLRNCHAPQAEIAQAGNVLDFSALTLGFARRFAGYKRATLLLRDPKRLETLLTNAERPVQIVFAGKAHPADNLGKELIRQIIRFARNDSRLRQRIVFLENHDIFLARLMVQGVDVWLNTPRRPQEASGTSGMKAAVNGALNVSVLDGWWCEGCSPTSGWAIGHGEEYDDHERQDAVESMALYNVLESEVVPLFYDRPKGDVPMRWTEMMKGAIRMGLSFFTSQRMVSEYNTRYYRRGLEDYERLTANHGAALRELVERGKRLEALWAGVKVDFPTVNRDVSLLHVGDCFEATARVQPGKLRADEIEVQVYYGPVDSENRIVKSMTKTMNLAESRQDGSLTYRCEIVCESAGRYGFTARAVPRGQEWSSLMPGFITWANGIASAERKPQEEETP
ncbi:MAG: alpha-glucan family phosphorylase [Verrucomicrobiota bacterium]|nr:alpha-glucan family phosphorylase [Verrucomicrobiota bacterium]